MRILFVNQHYPPDGGATGKLVAELSERLVALGHDVTVLTGWPTYRNATHGARFHETRAGVEVVRLPILPRWNGAIARTLHYASFALSAAIRGPWLRRPDVVLAFSSTPLFGGLAARWIAKRHASRLVYVVQDVYPEIAVALGELKPGIVQRIAHAVDRWVWTQADRVVLIGESLRSVAAERGFDPAAFPVIPNWADPDRITPLAKSAFRAQVGIGADEFVVQYAGNVGRSQDFELILEAARLVALEDPSVCFLIVGSGSADAEVRRAASESGQVKIIPFQPERILPEVLAVADVSVVPLREGLTRYCVPSKFYSITASGRAVAAALDPDSDVARWIDELDCGFRVDPGDAEGLARGILALSRDRARARRQGANGRSFAESLGSLDRAVADYDALLREVVTSPVAESRHEAELPTIPTDPSPERLDEPTRPLVDALESAGIR